MFGVSVNGCGYCSGVNVMCTKIVVVVVLGAMVLRYKFVMVLVVV